MCALLHPTKLFLACLVSVAVGVGPMARADVADSNFYKAYYLEHAESDWAQAADLYAEVADSSRVSESIRDQARVRLAACNEELASSDFAKLLPPDTIFFAEVNRPGEQLIRLLDQLGLVADGEWVGDEAQQRLAISPALVREILGVRGAAVGITGFDPQKQMPMGVAIFHPGNVEVLRGMLETGLPIGGKPVKPINGHPTFEVEGQAIVTLTSRLAVVSTQRHQIVSVMRRLSGEEKSNLADSGNLEKGFAQREDSLVYFCVNAKPLMPMINGLMQMAASANREAAMAQALLDINSLRSLVGNLGVNDDGLFLELALRLDDGHHNLLFNFLRSASLNTETLRCVPNGAAFVVAAAINEPGSRFSPGSPSTADGEPIVSALDIGREIFANVTSLAVFGMPSSSGNAACGEPIPDVGLAITVNDAAKSRALWTHILGIASLATGAHSLQGEAVNIAGVDGHKFAFPEDIDLYVATAGNDVLIAPSKSVLAGAIEAKKSNRSIADDPAFAAAFSRITPGCTKAIVAHAGRCAEIGKLYMSPADLAEAGPFLDAMKDTVFALTVEHSDNLFRVSSVVSGMPKVGGIISAQLMKEMNRGKDLDEFKRLAASPNRQSEAAAKCDTVYEQMKDDATQLNNLAWQLLTNERYDNRFDDYALHLAMRSNQLTDHSNWMFVDTLAWAKFKNGAINEAIELEHKALELCREQSPGRVEEIEETLAKFGATPDEVQLAGTSAEEAAASR